MQQSRKKYAPISPEEMGTLSAMAMALRTLSVMAMAFLGTLKQNVCPPVVQVLVEPHCFLNILACVNDALLQ